ncbi:MAG TPA: 2-oxoacid:acceptor oxidoreductase family protein, partial [Aggregicoccus sp.]|nr:2-oxoacid:acceptor oxidoreductase family protein [Aggregicoccus sp.]
MVVRFAGDSGDGIQVTGSQFADTTGYAGNDLLTFPDYPSEIRAPQGTLAGVSGYQIMFSQEPVFTPGDRLDVLVALNPAALKVNLKDLERGGVLVVNSDAFDAKNLEKAGYKSNPLEDGSLSEYHLTSVAMTQQCLQAVAHLKLSHKDAERTKNFYALGLVYWIFNRPLEPTLQWFQEHFARKEASVAAANVAALKAGHAVAESLELQAQRRVVPAARLPPGRYKNASGNETLALGLLTAAELSGLPLYLGTYPITPATDILHFLARQKGMGVTTFQAEDEIAAMASTIGAAYGGSLAVTTTSGPGLSLKTEGLGLAVMLELPMVVVNVQRAGPSTGLPTKTEQSDLLMALFGRHGEAPLPVIAASSPADCYWAAIEAARIAVRHMTPVILLSDSFLANGTEPWRIPEMSELTRFPVQFHTKVEG